MKDGWKGQEREMGVEMDGRRGREGWGQRMAGKMESGEDENDKWKGGKREEGRAGKRDRKRIVKKGKHNRFIERGKEQTSEHFLILICTDDSCDTH